MVFLPLIFSLMLSSDKKDDNEKLDISDVFLRTQVEATYEFQAKLTFLSDGTFIWEPVGSVEGHVATGASYEIVSDTQLCIFNDSDCGTEGVYSYVHVNNKLTSTHITDGCTPRVNALEGEWQK